MIRINLLPHRELRRKALQKQFYFMAVCVLGVGIAIWGAVHTLLVGQLQEQNGRNAYLQSEISALDKQIEEIKRLKEQTAALLQRKTIVESLQANRSETVHLVDQLVRQLPDGVYLKGIAQKDKKVTINGYAQSNARVSTFMRNLDASPYLEKPNLVEIKAYTDKTIRLSEFTLSVELTRANDTSTPAKPGAPGTPAKPGAPATPAKPGAPGTPPKPVAMAPLATREAS